MTIEIIGTGGIIEGNLGAANVNVNLDASVRLSAANTNGNYIGIPSNTELEALETGGTVSIWCKFNTAGASGNFTNLIGIGTAGASGLIAGIFRYQDSGNVFFTIKHADGSGSYIGSTAENLGTWQHYALSFDDGAIKSYVNGKLITTDTTAGDTYTIPTATINGDSLCGFIGSESSSVAENSDMEIADARIYDSALSQADIQILASKIRSETSLVSASSDLLLQYKLDGTDISSSTVDNAEGTAGRDGIIKEHDGTASTHTLVRDAFSVDVQDNSTTTDGTFTVTQGKVEGKALSHLAFDGTDDNVSTTKDSLSLQKATIACWIKPAAVTGSGSTEQALITSAYYNNNNFHLGQRNINKRFIFSVGNGDSLQFDLDITADRWHHLILSYTSGGGTDWLSAINIYLDGVEIPTANYIGPTSSGTCETLTASSPIHIGGKSGVGFFDGDIRDMRLYDYALSAEQAASLYSGTYPQTPLHWWKLDDSIQGVTTDTAIDSGTGTAANGTLDGIGGSGKSGEAGASSGWQNGTLDLDGQLKMQANGIFSAPRGTLSLDAHFTNNSSVETNVSGVYGYQHNDGLLLFTNDSDTTVSITGSRSTVLYNLTSEESGYHAPDVVTDLFIERDWTNKHSRINGGVTVTMGTDSYASTIQCNSGNGLDFTNNTSSAAILKAKNSLKPVTITGESGGGVDFDNGGSGSKVELADINYVGPLTTGGNGVTITLTGDCEFDAVTVSSGDTLDLNGQRAVFSGVLQNSGAIKSTGGGLIIADDNIKQSGSMEGMHDGDVNVIVNGGTAHDWRNGAVDGHAPWCRHLLTNGTVQVTDDVGRIDGTQYYNPESIIVGSGTLTNTTDKHYVKDMTIATGGTFTPSHANVVVGVAGDFTTSGGLIGKSALLFDETQADEKVAISDHSSLDLTTAATLMAWIKVPADGGSKQKIISKAYQAYEIGLQSGQLTVYHGTDASGGWNSVQDTTGADLRDAKWHHVAATFDNGNTIVKLYVDGKYVANETTAFSAINNSDDLSIGFRTSGSGADDFMDGHIGVASVWNAVLTQAQIRESMFYDFATADSSGTIPDGNCVGWWQFDEGTGSTVEDLSAQSNNGTISNAAWAGAGTLSSVSTSTLTMSGSNKFINYNGGNLDIGNLNVTGTISIKDLDGGNSSLRLTGNTFTCGSGATLSSDSSEKLRFMNGMDAGTVTFADPATNVVGLSAIFNEITSPRSLNIPEVTMFYFRNNGSGSTVATANHTFNSELEINNGTYNANGNTIVCKYVDVNGGTLNLSNSTLNFSVTSDADAFDMNDASTLITGNTTITGNSSASRTSALLPAAGGFEVVGDIKWLKVYSGSDLTVIGRVIDCELQDSTANIRQWHHTLDTQQLLDADEAGDDDLRLTKPSLDNSHELQTG